jgi:hypothetical protein
MTQLADFENRMIENTIRRHTAGALSDLDSVIESATAMRKSLVAGTVPFASSSLLDAAGRLNQRLAVLEAAREIRAVLSSA